MPPVQPQPNANPQPPGPVAPGYYGQPPAPQQPAVPDPNEPPAWAKGLIDSVGEVKQGYQELTQRIDQFGGEDPNANPNNQPPQPVQPQPNANPNDPYADWKPKDWSDVPRTAEEIVDRKLAMRDQAAAEANERLTQARQQADREIDTKLNELETKGVLPKVTNASDPNDPGRAMQRELIGLAVYQGKGPEDFENVASDLKFHHERGFKWDPQNQRWLETNRPPAGQYAPVGSSSGGNMPGQGGAQKPTYQEIHGARSLGELAQRSGRYTQQ
jgi:hypothetical protein